MHLDAFARRAGDYRIPGGVQANSGVRAEGGAVGGSTFFDGGYFGLALVTTRSLYHIPGAQSAANNTRIDMEQTKLLGKGEFRPDSAVIDAVRLWFGATEYRHFEKSIGDDGIDGVQATFRNREQEARVETQLQPVNTPLGVWTAAPGIQFNHQNLGTGGEAGSLLAPSETTTGAFYLFNELRVSPTLKLQAAGRIDRAHVAGTAASFPADLDGLSGDAGRIRRPSRLHAAQRKFRRVAGASLRPRRCRLGAICRARAARARALCQGSARRLWDLRDRRSEPDEGSRNQHRGMPAQAARNMALRCDPVPHALPQLHLPPGNGPALRRRFRLLRSRRRHRTASGGVRATRCAIPGRRVRNAARSHAARRTDIRRRRAVRLRRCALHRRLVRAPHSAAPARRRRVPAKRRVVCPRRRAARIRAEQPGAE